MSVSKTKKAEPKRASKSKQAPRFTLVDKLGKRVNSVDRAIAILDTEQNIWIDLHDAANGAELNHADAMAAAAAVRTGGKKDWRAPTDRELANLADRTRSRPAADPILNFLPTWYWTSTPVASFPDCAWFVSFGYGNVYHFNRHYECRVRAVRAASQ